MNNIYVYTYSYGSRVNVCRIAYSNTFDVESLRTFMLSLPPFKNNVMSEYGIPMMRLLPQYLYNDSSLYNDPELDYVDGMEIMHCDEDAGDTHYISVSRISHI